MALELFVVTLILLLLLDAIASYYVIQDDFSTFTQKIAQITFVWCIPILGALLTLHLKKKQPDGASGHYSEEHDPGNELDYPLKIHQRSNDRLQGETSGEEGDANL